MSNRQQVRLLCLSIALVAIAMYPVTVAAWQIQSGITSPCHEQLTLSAIKGITGGAFSSGAPEYVNSPLFPPVNADVDGVVAGVADEFASVIGLEFGSDNARLAGLSLIAGVRYPDINDSSAYNFFVMRPLMVLDEFEFHHFLRKSADDKDEGNVVAVQAGQEYIRSQIGLALEAASLPLEQRFVTHRIAIDLYGEVDVLLYEPLFRFGVALHAFEDSFAHTLRSDDLHEVLSVLNSIDAISDDFDERRDGIAHSMAMDSCMGENHDIAVVAADAVRELVAAVSLRAAADVAAGQAPPAEIVPVTDPVEDVILSWLEYAPGCGFDNNYCDSIWLHTVRKRPIGPLLAMALGCDSRSGHERDAGMDLTAVLLMSVLGLMIGRAVRKGRPS
jgi:hypothetical protein